MKTNKLAIFTHGIRRGPFERVGTSLARGFRELGHSCDLVVLNAGNEERAKYPDINLVSLNTRRAAFSLPHLIRYIREQKPDVIFSTHWYFNVIAILAKNLSRTNTKVIIGEQNICSLESRVEHGDKLKIRLLPLLMRYTYPYGDGLIAVSQDIITDLTQELNISTKNIHRTVISNPINVPHIQKLAEESIDHPWFQDNHPPVILTVARLAKQKQLDILIRSFAQVLKTTDAKLLILGDGPLRAELENLCQELAVENHVSMPGYDHNPYRFMSACDVFVLTSAWEGCPIALEEALVCGAAAIVNDAPGGSKDVVEHGKFGMVVPTKNSEALSQAILQLLNDHDLKQHYQKQARIRSQDFKYLQVSRKYLDFYESTIASSSESVRANSYQES